MKIFIVLVILLGILLTLGAALPFFNNDVQEILPAAQFDYQNQFAPADLTDISSSSSTGADWDSTPSDGGGDTNPTPPTDPPGGRPTQGSSGPILISTRSVGGITAGVILGLVLIVGIAVAVFIFVIKKKA